MANPDIDSAQSNSTSSEEDVASSDSRREEVVWLPPTSAEECGLFKNLLNDIETMYDYARERGIAPPNGVIEGLSRLFAVSKSKPPEGPRLPPQMTNAQPALKLAMAVHRDLSQAISPATPDTIRVSSFWQNSALKTIAVIGLIGLVLFVIGTLLSSIGAHPSSVPKGSGNGAELAALAGLMIRGSGAILGSAFYSFWTAREYLRDGTFNRQYSQVYVIRFCLGVIAGFVLGSLVTDSSALSDAAKKFGPFTLSVVGGFSAEAVVQILQRIADILIATVRGSDKERAKADAERMTAKKMNNTAAKLQEALQSPSPEATKAAVQKIMRDMMKT